MTTPVSQDRSETFKPYVPRLLIELRGRRGIEFRTGMRIEFRSGGRPSI